MYSSYPVDLCSVCEWNEGKRSGEKITSVIYASELYCVCAHKTKVSM